MPTRQHNKRAWWVSLFLISLIAGIAAAGAAAWRWWPRAETSAAGVQLGRLPGGVSRAKLNVVLVTLDTTRADHLGAYGAGALRTPFLDELARDGVVFDQAMTVAPLTLPAHSSIFTGRFPPEHGVRDNGGFFLSPNEVTLAETLAEAGFQTGAAVGAYVLDHKWGLDQGFKTYLDDFDLTNVKAMSLASVRRPGNEVVDKALTWLAGVADQQFFAWVHLYDPHAPYEPPEPFRSQYAGHPYKGAVAFADAQVGRLLGFLRERGLYDRTIVVVIADHGESLGEHGEDTHGFFIYQSSMHVPLIVRAPFGALGGGRHVAEPVRSVDVMPTVLDLLQLAAPKSIEGISLVPLMAGKGRDLGLESYAEAMYPLHHFGWSDLTALRSGRYKLIDAPKPELYDLERDPNETNNLFGQRSTVGDAMQKRLRAMTAEMARTAPAQPAASDVDPETRSRLAALGYVGSFVATSTAPRTGLADPKDKIELFNLMTTARDASKGASGFENTVAMLRKVVVADPKVIDAWFMLGNEYFKAERFPEAVEHFSRALALKPDYDLALINMANAYRRMGRDDAALAGYERYVQIDPKNAYVRYQIGEIYLDRDDRVKAEADFRAALAIDPKLAPAHVALGALAFERGDAAGADRQLREALAIKQDVRLAHYNLALMAEEQKDFERAAAEYQAEIDLHPTTYKAAFNLGRLHARLGRNGAAITAYQKAVDANPKFAEGYFYLAKAYLDEGARLDEAVAVARKGLALDAKAPTSPLGHFVIAGVLMKQGRSAEAQREFELGTALEAKLGRIK